VDGLILHGAMMSGFMREVYPHVRELLNNISEDEFIGQFRKDLTKTVSLPGPTAFLF